MRTSSIFSVSFITALVFLNVSLSQARLPPPMLRAVCSAFADAEEAIGNQALSAGKKAFDVAMMPIQLVGGLKAAAVGTGMKVTGGAIKFVGAKLAKDGGLLEATGAGLKGAGLGVAAMGLRPLADKVVAASQLGQKPLDNLKDFTHSIGDTSIQIDATIDSPFIGHHHKGINMTTGLDTLKSQLGHNTVGNSNALSGGETSEQTQSSQQTTTTVDAKTIAKRAQRMDADVMRAALSLVREAKMEDCVCRAICDLNCNGGAYGQDGRQVIVNMVKLQGAKLMDPNELKTFTDALAKGRGLGGKCYICTEAYPKCHSKTSDLIKMASHIRMESV